MEHNYSETKYFKKRILFLGQISFPKFSHLKKSESILIINYWSNIWDCEDKPTWHGE